VNIQLPRRFAAHQANWSHHAPSHTAFLGRSANHPRTSTVSSRAPSISCAAAKPSCTRNSRLHRPPVICYSSVYLSALLFTIPNHFHLDHTYFIFSYFVVVVFRSETW
jgi:hypothetical protein